MKMTYKYQFTGILILGLSILDTASEACTSRLGDKPHYQFQNQQIDLPAEFPGGISEARQFIAHNLRYPKEAQRREVEGTVQVKFSIEKDGSIGNIEIVKKLGYGLDEEVVRVIKKMPKWIPAKSSGKPVQSYFTMPVSFALH